MRHLFYLMGKSASGKDTMYEALLEDAELNLSPLVTWTTRPIRAAETDGVEYHFTDPTGLEELESVGKVIEKRTYQTVHGPWTYFTVADDAFSADSPGKDLLGIGTLESYVRIRDYCGAEKVIPLYIEVDDDLRMARALKREQKPGNGRYEEMKRRFQADQQDFSEEKLTAVGIVADPASENQKRFPKFQNNSDRALCLKELKSYIMKCQHS